MSTETEDQERQEDEELYWAEGVRAFKKQYGPDELFVVLSLSAMDAMTPDQFYIYSICAFEQFVSNFKSGPYAKGIRDLSGRSGLSQQKVSDILDELHAMGWVRVIRNGTKATTVDVLKAPRYNRPGNVPLVERRRKVKKPAPKFDPITGEIIKRASPVKCSGITNDGKPCGQYVTEGSYCRHHVNQDTSHEMGAAVPTRWMQPAHEMGAKCNHVMGRGADAVIDDVDVVGVASPVSASQSSVTQTRAETFETEFLSEHPELDDLAESTTTSEQSPEVSPADDWWTIQQRNDPKARARADEAVARAREIREARPLVRGQTMSDQSPTAPRSGREAARSLLKPRNPSPSAIHPFSQSEDSRAIDICSGNEAM